MKCRIVLAITMLALIAFGSFTAAYVLMSDPVNQSTYAQIHRGMTKADVIRLIGKPCDVGYPFDGQGPGGEAMIWHSNAGRICVYIEECGAVEAMQFDENQDSLSRKVRRWLGIDPPPSPFQTPTSGPVIFPDY